MKCFTYIVLYIRFTLVIALIEHNSNNQDEDFNYIFTTVQNKKSKYPLDFCQEM